MNKYLVSDFWIGILTAAMGWAASFIIPIIPFLLTIIVIVLADLYTGTKAAIAINQRLIDAKSPEAKKPNEVIHSQGLRRSIEKIKQYFIAILVTELMSVVFGFKEYHIPLTYMMALGIAGVEYKSNIENIQIVTGNIHLWNFVKDHIFKSKK